MNTWIIAPIIIPLLTALALVFTRERAAWTTRISLLGGLALVLACAGLVYQTLGGVVWVQAVGAWPAPFGITLVVDRLASWLLAAGSIVALAAHTYALASFDSHQRRVFGVALMHLQVLGVNWCFLTGDLFNLFVGVEVMLMASYALLTLGGHFQQVRHGVLYLTLNLLSSTTFLVSLALLYGITGTLNMAHLSAWILQNGLSTPLVGVWLSLVLIAFAIKAGLFPLFVWLPNAYVQAPTAITILLAGLLTKVGVYVLLRVSTLIAFPLQETLQPLWLTVGGVTMLLGVLGAAAQSDMKKILSIHILSQIGYMIMGLALMTPLALAGTLLHMIHNMWIKCALFGVAGVVESATGHRQLKKLGGLVRRAPWLAIVFLAAAWSLAGLPPFSGFFTKLILLIAGVKEQALLIVAVGLITGFFTLFSMMKIWRYAFWEPTTDTTIKETPLTWPRALLRPATGLLLASVLLVAAMPWVIPEAISIGDELLHPEHYRAAVLGEFR